MKTRFRDHPFDAEATERFEQPLSKPLTREELEAMLRTPAFDFSWKAVARAVLERPIVWLWRRLR